MSATSSSASAAIVWGLVLLGGLAVLGVVVLFLRRWIFRPPPPAGEDWSLQHLREMKARGQITSDEFEKLKARVIGGAKGRAGFE